MVVTKIPKKTITVIEPKRVNIVDRNKYNQTRMAAYCRVSTDSEEQLLSYGCATIGINKALPCFFC